MGGDRWRRGGVGLLGAWAVLGLACCTHGRPAGVRFDARAPRSSGDGVLALCANGPGGAEAGSRLWVIDPVTKRMSSYEFDAGRIVLRGMRDFTYDLEPEEYPASDGGQSVARFREWFLDEWRKDAGNAGKMATDQLVRNSGPGVSAPAKLLAVAGAGSGGSAGGSLLWLVERSAHRVALYVSEETGAIRLAAARSYTYDHEFQLEYPSKGPSPTVGELRKAFEERQKRLGGAGNAPPLLAWSPRTHKRLRLAMVSTQLEARGVTDARVLDAFRAVHPGERVPPDLVQQLAPGGRMVLLRGTWNPELVLVRRTETGFQEMDRGPLPPPADAERPRTK